MKDIVSLIFDNNFTEAKEKLEAIIDQKIEEKLFEKRVELVSEMFGELECDLNIEELNEAKSTGRIKVVRMRIRGGKVQTKKKFSAVKGYTPVSYTHLTLPTKRIV